MTDREAAKIADAVLAPARDELDQRQQDLTNPQEQEAKGNRRRQSSLFPAAFGAFGAVVAGDFVSAPWLAIALGALIGWAFGAVLRRRPAN